MYCIINTLVFWQVWNSLLFSCVITLVGCRLVRFEAKEKGRKRWGWLQDGSFLLINIQMEFCSWEVCSVIEEKWECGCGKGWRNGVWILPTVDLNCSIKLLNYQIFPLIDFPKPSASGWANLKAMRLSTWSELFFFFLSPNPKHWYI